MQTLPHEEPMKPLKVNEFPASLIRAVKIKAATDGTTVRAIVIEAVRQFTTQNQNTSV